jgi:hypothetical protein
MLYDIESHRQRELAPADADYPIWAHKGHSVYFRNEYWNRVGLDYRKAERVANLDGVGARPAMPSRGVPTWTDWWAGLTPDDSLLTTSEGGSIEIYSAAFVPH